MNVSNEHIYFLFLGRAKTQNKIVTTSSIQLGFKRVRGIMTYQTLPGTEINPEMITLSREY